MTVPPELPPLSLERRTHLATVLTICAVPGVLLGVVLESALLVLFGLLFVLPRLSLYLVDARRVD